MFDLCLCLSMYVYVWSPLHGYVKGSIESPKIDKALTVSLTVSVCNGTEIFVFQPVLAMADLSDHGRRQQNRGQGGRGRL